jgi:hypothetical protein
MWREYIITFHENKLENDGVPGGLKGKKKSRARDTLERSLQGERQFFNFRGQFNRIINCQASELTGAVASHEGRTQGELAAKSAT